MKFTGSCCPIAGLKNNPINREEKKSRLRVSRRRLLYNRQFITRKAVNHGIITSLDNLLDSYFKEENTLKSGLPSVKYISTQLKLSQRYLSDMLRSLTGLNTQQYIQSAIIEKAKEKLSTTNLSVSEIAYELGFEHSQSFSKLFKSKTKLSPLAFRQSFN